jgi:hypothetical protein
MLPAPRCAGRGAQGLEAAKERAVGITLAAANLVVIDVSTVSLQMRSIKMRTRTRQTAIGVMALALACACIAGWLCPALAPAAQLTANQCCVVDNFNSPGEFAAWTVSGGPQASVTPDHAIHYGGRMALRFHVRVDYATGPAAPFQGGWRFLTCHFNQPADWSHFKTLRFYLYVPPNQPLGPLKYSITCPHPLAGGRTIWNSVCGARLKPGGWVKVTCPLDSFHVRGSLHHVTGLRFYVAENWYKDHAKLNFLLDDISLGTRWPRVMRTSQPLRKASEPVSLLPDELAHHTPAIYPVIPLEFIYPNTDLTHRQPVRAFAFTAAPGEIHPLTFAVMAGNAPIKGLSVAVSSLKGPSGRMITRRRFDVLVVKVWQQPAVGYKVYSPGDAILVPELLVKNDLVPLRGRKRASGIYAAPSLLQRPFYTDVPAHTVKQVWIDVSLPGALPPGPYHGTVLLRAASGLPKRLIPLTVKVLPFALPQPRLLYGIYYRLWLSFEKNAGMAPDQVVSRRQMLNDFRELHTASVNAIMNEDMPTAPTIMRLMVKAGMKGPLVLEPAPYQRLPAPAQVARLARDARQLGLGLYWYGVDEASTPAQLKRQAQLTHGYHRLKQRIITAILPRLAARLRAEGAPLDWANLSLGNQLQLYIKRFRAGQAERVAPVMTYYWQDYYENPTNNRRLAGYYAWASDLDGVFPYQYQGTPGAQAYVRKVAGWGKFQVRPGNLLYPGRTGPVETLLWEGFRLGVMDVRYLTYLRDLIRQARRARFKRAAATTQDELNHTLASWARPLMDIHRSADPVKNPASFGQTRRRIISLILKLRSVLAEAKQVDVTGAR